MTVREYTLYLYPRRQETGAVSPIGPPDQVAGCRIFERGSSLVKGESSFTHKRPMGPEGALAKPLHEGISGRI